MEQKLTITYQYALFGVAFGLCFPLGGWAFECLLNGHQFTWEGIKLIHKTTPVHFIIDSAPFVLGCTACFIGRIQKRAIDDAKQVKKELEKSQKLAMKDQYNTKRITEFSIFVSMGNLDFEVDVFGNDDELGNSLQAIQKNLFEASEKDRVERWRAEGLTQFLQILRDKQGNIDLLTKTLVSSLAQFLKCYYGAIYLLDETEGDQLLKQYASYAGKGALSQKISPKVGEGLIGQTFKSKKSALLNNLPDNYAKITSGLGEASPKCLFLVPLVHNEKATGVIELGRFKSFTEEEIAFIEKLGENIASTIISAQSNTRNNLLLERSEKLANELRTSEESMRQQIEEMRATQEELDRQNRSTSKKITSIETIVGKIKWSDDNEIKNPEIFNN